LFEHLRLLLWSGISKNLPRKHPQMMKSQPNYKFRTSAITFDQLDLISDYRSISALPSFSKIFEKIVYNRQMNYLTNCHYTD